MPQMRNAKRSTLPCPAPYTAPHSQAHMHTDSRQTTTHKDNEWVSSVSNLPTSASFHQNFKSVLLLALALAIPQ